MPLTLTLTQAEDLDPQLEVNPLMMARLEAERKAARAGKGRHQPGKGKKGGPPGQLGALAKLGLHISGRLKPQPKPEKANLKQIDVTIAKHPSAALLTTPHPEMELAELSESQPDPPPRDSGTGVGAGVGAGSGRKSGSQPPELVSMTSGAERALARAMEAHCDEPVAKKLPIFGKKKDELKEGAGHVAAAEL